MRIRAHRLRFAALSVAALLATASGTADAAVRAPGDHRPLGTETLSDERTLSRWAHTAEPTAVRAQPRPDAPRVARLRWNTEDAEREVYLVLASRGTDTGVWLRIRVPMRPNGATGWVPRDALGTLHVVRTHLRVDRRRLVATLRRAGRRIWSSRIGVGARGTPTPGGRFWIRERLRGGGGIYGPWAFGTSAYSVLSDWPGGGVVGIHGTNQPWLIPGRPSHGCVRVPNRRIRRLAHRMPIGTPVHIS